MPLAPERCRFPEISVGALEAPLCSTRARGISSVTGGTVTLAPGLPPYGLWKSTDGGANFTLLNAEGVCLNPTLAGDAGKIQSSFGSARGVNHVALDPGTSATIYAAAFPRVNATGGGVWRSTNGGANWTQIKTALNATRNTDRAEFAVTRLGNGNTRMYVGDGNDLISSANRARFYRSDDVATGTPVFTDLTTNQNRGYCDNGINGATYAEYPLVIFSQDGKKEIARVTADGNGNYRVALPPGAYILDVQDRARKHVRAKPQRFTVVSNQIVRVDMDIDTGIRSMLAP